MKSNIPVVCNVCTAVVWRYNMYAHHKDKHSELPFIDKSDEFLTFALLQAKGVRVYDPSNVPQPRAKKLAVPVRIAVAGRGAVKAGVRIVVGAGAGAGAGTSADTGVGAGVVEGVGAGADVLADFGGAGAGGGGEGNETTARSEDDESDDDASVEEEVPATVVPVTPFIDGDVVSRKSGGSTIGTIISTYFAPSREGISLAYSVRWEQDDSVEANMFHAELQKAASGRRHVVRDFKALAQFGRRR